MVESKEIDLMVIGNPLLDISVMCNDNTLLDKYGMKSGEACLASEEQLPIYAEILATEGHETMPGGAGLNSCRGAIFAMKQAGYETKGVTYFGSIGEDAYGNGLEKTLSDAGIISNLYKDKDTATGTCAAVVVGKERSLCANLGACVKYPTSHLEANMAYLEGAKMVYATAFFITSNAAAHRQVAEFCAANDKPFVFNIAAPWIMHTNYDDVMHSIEHADYVFCNEDEGSLMAEKQGFEALDRLSAAKFVCNYKKANGKRNRIAVITQGAEPILIAESQPVGEPKITMIPVPKLDQALVIDTNGAGDALVGAFLAGMARGLSLEESLKEGIKLSSKII